MSPGCPSSVPPFHHRWRYYPSVGDFATARKVYDRTAIFFAAVVAMGTAGTLFHMEFNLQTAWSTASAAQRNTQQANKSRWIYLVQVVVISRCGDLINTPSVVYRRY